MDVDASDFALPPLIDGVIGMFANSAGEQGT
jgi:hypothetical protein